MPTNESTGLPRPRDYPQVVKLADAMREKLLANAHKGSWQHVDVGYLLDRLNDEVAELEAVCRAARNYQMRGKGEDPDLLMKVRQEAADVANFAMMVADVLGALP